MTEVEGLRNLSLRQLIEEKGVLEDLVKYTEKLKPQQPLLIGRYVSKSRFCQDCRVLHVENKFHATTKSNLGNVLLTELLHVYAPVHINSVISMIDTEIQRREKVRMEKERIK